MEGGCFKFVCVGDSICTDATDRARGEKDKTKKTSWLLVWRGKGSDSVYVVEQGRRSCKPMPCLTWGVLTVPHNIIKFGTDMVAT